MYSIDLIVDDWSIHEGWGDCSCDDNIRVSYSHSIHTFELEESVNSVKELMNVLCSNVPHDDIIPYYGEYFLEIIDNESFNMNFYGKYSEMQENAKGLIVIGDELNHKFLDDVEFFKDNRGLSVDRMQKRIEIKEN